MKIAFDFENNEWYELPSGSKEGLYIDADLMGKLENIRKIQKKGYDVIFVIDGDRRTGKSILGMTLAWILSDCKLTLNNFAIGVNDAKEKIKTLPDESILFVDEGSLVFNSKDSMRNELKELIKVMDVVGQKRIIFIVVLPCFFDLAKPIATRFSRFLLHVYTDNKLNRGRFAYFGEYKKKGLYEVGKKNFGSYKKPGSDFIGRFIDFHVPFYDDYLKLKNKTLMAALDDSPASVPDHVLVNWRTEVIQNNLNHEVNITQAQLSKLLGISDRTIRNYLTKIKELSDNKGEIVLNTAPVH